VIQATKNSPIRVLNVFLCGMALFFSSFWKNSGVCKKSEIIKFELSWYSQQRTKKKRSKTVIRKLINFFNVRGYVNFWLRYRKLLSKNQFKSAILDFWCHIEFVKNIFPRNILHGIQHSEKKIQKIVLSSFISFRIASLMTLEAYSRVSITSEVIEGFRPLNTD
jgi:hypothetical protein